MLETKELVTSRWKAATALLGSLAFVAIAVFLPSQAGESDQWRWWGAGFFGLCALVLVWVLIRPQRLTLDPEGFTLRGGFVRSPKKILWRNIDPFFIYRVPRGGNLIGFNFKAGARPDPTLLMKINRRLGAEGALPKLWPGSPDRLVEELNAYRERALQRTPAAQSRSTNWQR